MWILYGADESKGAECEWCGSSSSFTSPLTRKNDGLNDDDGLIVPNIVKSEFERRG